MCRLETSHSKVGSKVGSIQTSLEMMVDSITLVRLSRKEANSPIPSLVTLIPTIEYLLPASRTYPPWGMRDLMKMDHHPYPDNKVAERERMCTDSVCGNELIMLLLCAVCVYVCLFFLDVHTELEFGIKYFVPMNNSLSVCASTCMYLSLSLVPTYLPTCTCTLYLVKCV